LAQSYHAQLWQFTKRSNTNQKNFHTDAVPIVAPEITVIGRITPLSVAADKGMQIANIPVA
jgi:hypothetical protein